MGTDLKFTHWYLKIHKNVLSFRYKECIQIGRCDKLKGLLLQILI